MSANDTNTTGNMRLSIVRDGHRFPYSVQQLKADNPNVSFPPDLSNFDLSAYGVIAEHGDERPVGSTSNKKHARVAMQNFLYGIRQYGLRVQFERYALCLEGHARDYWMAAPYVSRSSTYVAHFAKHFQIPEYGLDAIFEYASQLEE